MICPNCSAKTSNAQQCSNCGSPLPTRSGANLGDSVMQLKEGGSLDATTDSHDDNRVTQTESHSSYADDHSYREDHRFEDRSRHDSSVRDDHSSKYHSCDDRSYRDQSQRTVITRHGDTHYHGPVRQAAPVDPRIAGANSHSVTLVVVLAIVVVAVVAIYMHPSGPSVIQMVVPWLQTTVEVAPAAASPGAEPPVPKTTGAVGGQQNTSGVEGTKEPPPGEQDEEVVVPWNVPGDDPPDAPQPEWNVPGDDASSSQSLSSGSSQPRSSGMSSRSSSGTSSTQSGAWGVPGD